MDSMMGLLKALPRENGRFRGKNWFPPLVRTYPRKTMASFFAPARTPSMGHYGGVYSGSGHGDGGWLILAVGRWPTVAQCLRPQHKPTVGIVPIHLCNAVFLV